MISVVLPAYKAKFLACAIDSILNQSYSKFELVIINDASPEDLTTIVSQYKDSRIKYHVNEKNIGSHNLVENWNKCIQYASGDFIVLASDDDVYDPKYLETMVSLSKKYPDIDLFHCRVAVIDEEGKTIHWGTSMAEYESDIDFIYQRAINRRTQVISDFMVKKTALEKIHGFKNYPKAWYSDEMTWYLIAKNKGVICAAETLFYWRSSSKNISSTNTDTLQKAEASYLYYNDMKNLIMNLSPHNKCDKYLLSILKERIHDSIATQLSYDLEKSKWNLIIQILGNKQYRNLLSKKFYIKILLGKFRLLLKL